MLAPSPATGGAGPVYRITPPIARKSTNMRQAFSLFALAAIIGLLPGSRRGEVERLSDPLVETASLLRQRYPGVRLVRFLVLG